MAPYRMCVSGMLYNYENENTIRHILPYPVKFVDSRDSEHLNDRSDVTRSRWDRINSRRRGFDSHELCHVKWDDRNNIDPHDWIFEEIECRVLDDKVPNLL